MQTIWVIITALVIWVMSALVHDFDIRRNCYEKGSMHLLIWKTSITCTVNVEK